MRRPRQAGRLHTSMNLVIDPAPLLSLQHKRIYFGHQSVGANILDGVRHLNRADTRLKLNLVESTQAQAYANPVLGHSRIGHNHEPRSKIDAFSDILDAGLGNKVDMALLKFCYVDVTETSDVGGLFEYYQRVMTQLATAYPRTQLVHVTVPLTVMPSLLRRVLGTLRRRHNRIAHDNLARAEYNRLLTQAYAGKAPLFDLAAIESTLPSGRRLHYQLQGREFSTLVPGYSSDGRHLSETGQRVVAAELLKFLAATALKSDAHV